MSLPKSSCALCASANLAGELVFSEEMRQARGPWVHMRVVNEVGLCASCLEWAEGLSQRIMNPDVPERMPLGLPSSPGIAPQDGSACEYCRSSFAEQSFSVEFVPTRLQFVRRSLYRHLGQIKQNRVCRQCHTWWQTTLEDSSSLKGTSYRAVEGSTGGWRGEVAFDAFSLFMSPRDQYVLETTVTAMGTRIAHTRADDVKRFHGFGDQTLFVGAGRRSRAADLVSSAAPSVAKRTVVVAQADSIADALAALKAGAVDLLASPISPQQIAGAFGRLSSPAADVPSDPATGLPIYAAPVPDHGLDAYLLEIRHPQTPPTMTYLLLRRFLRGYDRVGLAKSGQVAVLVYCEPRYIDGVTRRIRFIMGDRASVTQAAHTPAVRSATHVA